jgi:5-methylcytosine-specific restriction endonuclease McrA
MRCGVLVRRVIVRGTNRRVVCDPCRPEAIKEAKARYRESHRDELRAKSREYAAQRRRDDPEYAERGRQHIRELTRTRPEYLSAIRKRSYRRHAAKRRADSRAQKAIRRAAIYQRDHGICHICGDAIAWEYFEIDHVIPRSRGGSDDEENLKASHRRCNRHKAARLTMPGVALGV